MSLLYANENFPLPAVLELRRGGRAIVTLNRKHFIRLHNQGSSHAGIIVCSYHPDFLLLSKKIHEVIQINTVLSAKLIRINRET